MPIRLARPASPPKGIVIACHGYRASWRQLADIAVGLARRGYVVLLMELRGHGERPGPCGFGLRESRDLCMLLDWVAADAQLSRLPVGLFGLSLGAAVVCQTVLRDPRPAALVLDSAYARLFPIVARIIRRDYGLPSVPWAWITWAGVHLALRARLSLFDPIRLVPMINRPGLLIHHELYAAWPSAKERWIAPGMGHVELCAMDPERYCDRIAEFYDRWLSAASPSSRC
ncbi:MAG: alpha/beta fold hydrolase [Candidatus Omnitrophica bacterium]|nr:alpha/beta fold hydrolase [Candidatus Omnitrophota bacterium]